MALPVNIPRRKAIRVKGVYHDPAGYFVDEAEAEAFDKTFPDKEKLKLPGQLF